MKIRNLILPLLATLAIGCSNCGGLATQTKGTHAPVVAEAPRLHSRPSSPKTPGRSHCPSVGRSTPLSKTSPGLTFTKSCRLRVWSPSVEHLFTSN